MKSVSTRKGIIQSIYRWIYANGWSASGASVFVSCLAFPLSPIPSTVMIGLGVALAALRLGVDYIEQILVMLEEDHAKEERMSAFKSGSDADDSDDDSDDDAIDFDAEFDGDLDELLDRWNRRHAPIAESGVRESDDLSGWH